MPYRLYTRPDLSTHLLVAYGEQWYLVPHISGGWHQRQPTFAHEEATPLEPVATWPALAALLGIPEHGGPRPGAGASPRYDEPMRRVSATLPEDVIAYALRRGQGNLSAGLREIIQEAMRMS
jgi:hypothetical protein